VEIAIIAFTDYHATLTWVLSFSGKRKYDNGNNEIRGGRVERDAGGDEKQLIKFTWLN